MNDPLGMNGAIKAWANEVRQKKNETEEQKLKEEKEREENERSIHEALARCRKELIYHS